MPAPKLIEKEIQAQKKIISKLKTEIFGIDKTGTSSYIRDFQGEFRSYQRICPVERVISTAAGADVVYVGDYHPLEASQDWLLRLMTELTARGRKIVLAMEMLYVHQQEFIDLWMKGVISEQEFLEAIDYESEWGFRWESYRRIFELAKDPFVPVFGIDAEPRDNLKFIRSRDRMIASRLANIQTFFPDSILLVFIGESHLAANHLPAELRRASGENFHEITIVQNIDEIYWSLLRGGKSDARAVKVREGTFCIFNASPIIKYQSYWAIMEYWIEGGEGDRITPILGEWFENILLFLFGEKRTVNVKIRGDWRVPIKEAFPEVQTRKTYLSLISYLRARRVSADSITAARDTLKIKGICYVAEANAYLVAKVDLVGAAEEIARFVVYAFRDEIGRRNRRRRSREDAFYAFAFEEALAYLGSKIIDPTRDFWKTDLLLGTMDARGVVRRPLPRRSLAETRRLVRLLKYHFRRDRLSGGSLKRTATLEKIYRLPVRQRRMLCRTLGATLGEAIYNGYHEGKVQRGELIDLFGESFTIPGRGRTLYGMWIRKTRPYRSTRGKGSD